MQTRLRGGCAVCGCDEVDRDEVLDAGVLGLAACRRCRHRWTERPRLHATAPRAVREEDLAAAA